MKEAPALSLDLVVERETIEIKSKRHKNGKLYELANVWDLGPTEHALVVDRNKLVQALLNRPKRTATQEAQLAKALGDVVKVLVPEIETAVLAEMTVAHRTAILFTWIAQNNKQSEGEGDAGNRRSRRTGS